MELSCGIDITITTNGNDACLDFAKEELQAYLTRMFARLNVVEKKGSARFVLSLRQSPMLRYDGYQIVITETDVRITSGQGRGVLHGVYHVLRMLGCSFWFSKASCQNIPTVRRKALPAGVYTENPLVEKRGIALLGINHDNIADVLATVDFMAKNCYNLLVTAPEINSNGIKEHSIHWEEIESTVLPHLMCRGIDICMAFGFSAIPCTKSAEPCTASDNSLPFDEASFESYVDDICNYIKDKPYIKTVGPLGFEYKMAGISTDIDKANRAFALLESRLHSVREDIVLLHSVNAKACTDTILPPKSAVLLSAPDKAFFWVHKDDKKQNVFLLDKYMADSFYGVSNVWIQPEQCKKLVSAAANAECNGVISLWAPISSWWAASLNFSIMSEAYYHPDFSIDEIVTELAVALWDACSAPLSKALRLTVYQLQDTALWSRPPRASLHIADHITHRNKIFDAQNAASYDKRYNEIMDIVNSVSLARLNEHGRYHLDCFKTYLALQKQYFHSVDQYAQGDIAADKLQPYYDLLQKAKDTIGEGFQSASYAKWRIEDNGII